MITPAQAAENIYAAADPIRQKYRTLRPDWITTDSPLKYVDWAMAETIYKVTALANVLNMRPGDSVVEIGPGACYLGYMLSRCYGCDWAGLDIADRPLYQDMADALGVQVTTWEMKPGGRLPDWPHVNLLVATQISWMDDWGTADVDAFMRQAFAVAGRVVLFPNPNAFGHRDSAGMFAGWHHAEVTMRYLGRGFFL